MPKLSAPTNLFWIIALVLGLLGLIASFVAIPLLSTYAFWLVVLAWLVLQVTTMLKGM
jgi:hypothetical protein